jgi:hypothetical protein
MKTFKIILILLGIILIVGIVIQVLRLDLIIKFTDTGTGLYEIKEYKTQKLSDEKIKAIKNDKYLIIYNENEEVSPGLASALEDVFKYMKKDCELKKIKEIKELGQYKNVIITFEDGYTVNFLSSLKRYLVNGGGVILAFRPALIMDEDGIYALLGIKDNRGFTETNGIETLTNISIYPTKEVLLENKYQNSSLDVTLFEDTVIHAVSEEDIPLVWEYKYNAGKIMVFNGSNLFQKNNRGLVAGMLGMLNDSFLYPVYNTKMSHIDDFPAPVPVGNNEAIYKEFRRTIAQYYREVWWPDMVKISKLYNVKHSGFVIMTYEDDVTPPFEIKQDLDEVAFMVYGRELIKQGGEIGIHGYNHQSLALDGFIKQDLGYKPWASTEDMKLGIDYVVDFSKQLYPGYKFYSYVPPSNILSPEGQIAVKRGMPDLKALCGLYEPSEEEDAYVTEIEILEDGILNMPRTSSGYHYSDEVKWSMVNSVTLHGYISHFIHPDDSLDSYRSKDKTWNQLIREFSDFYYDINKKYPWLRPMITYEAALEVESVLKTDIYIEEKEDEINILIDNYSAEVYFYYWNDKKPEFEGEARAIKVNDGIYLIRASEPEFKIIK